MDLSNIKRKIKGNIGREIFFYETVGSTNTTAMDLSGKTAEGTIVLADYQEKGRGRLGRTWISPAGDNIYMSIILKPDIEPQDSTLITIMAAVGCAIALRRVTGLNISIKWPNDLMVSEKKIGGILTELKTASDKIVVAIVGIGINLNMEIDMLPDDIRKIATSVKNEAGKSYSREDIIAEILNEMSEWNVELKGMNRQRLLSEWRHLTSTLGKEVNVIAGKESFKGFAESIDDKGMLILRLPSGDLKRISSGDLTILR
jgi:BirA family transcriptional regulator, biotin operon repressor / biotin---[acetyl-CoA-carboxylase] ligase